MSSEMLDIRIEPVIAQQRFVEQCTRAISMINVTWKVENACTTKI